MRRTLVTILGLLCATAVAAQNVDVIKSRQAIYKGMAAATKTPADMLKGAAPYDAKIVQASLDVYIDAAKKLPALFPDDSKIGSDTQALDHPLGTAIGPHGPGAPNGLLPELNEEYFRETGRRVIEDFPEWEPCHNAILSAGICGFENVGGDIDKVISAERWSMFRIFAVFSGVMLILSLFLARQIAEPMRRLADAAQRVRRGIKARHEIPDFTDRADEIGHLSGALRDMTQALYRRIDAIESFAADVSHELKNPQGKGTPAWLDDADVSIERTGTSKSDQRTAS